MKIDFMGASISFLHRVVLLLHFRHFPRTFEMFSICTKSIISEEEFPNEKKN